MSGTRGFGCALGFGVVLTLAGGCAIDDAFTLAAFAQGKDHLFAGHIDDVTIATAVALKNLNLTAETTRDGDTIRVAGATKSGKKFLLHLTAAEGKAGPATKVRIAWENGTDEAFWFQLLEGMAEAHLSLNAKKVRGAS